MPLSLINYFQQNMNICYKYVIININAHKYKNVYIQIFHLGYSFKILDEKKGKKYTPCKVYAVL